ncbi:MAG: leucine-rich repeat domain-containing protein [Clostridia bacterium]|nr:leucine-rich repeat domain-containing protein [Clostridia bacterium]
MCIKCNNLIIQEHTFSDITCDKCSYSKQPLDIFYYKAIFSGIEIVGLKDTTATEIIIPENVSSISYAAFRNHKDISYVFIPADVDFIGAYAFYGCTNITIYCEAYSKPKNWSDEWNIGNYPVVWDCKNQYPNNIENT